MMELLRLLDISTNTLKDVEMNIRLQYETASGIFDLEKLKLIGIPENYIRNVS